jgi:polyphosphate kinase 2
LFELSGQTLAVIGFGAIGTALAERAAAFGMNVIGVRRSALRARRLAPGRRLDVDERPDRRGAGRCRSCRPQPAAHYRDARTVFNRAPGGDEWYFQRYVSHLPAAGELVLFDRSWYNRAGVERAMGFCTDAEYEEFFRSVPEFERMLVRSGIQLLKYWISITDDEQHLRFLGRIRDPLKQWKLSPMDLESRRRWEAYTVAKEVMLERTHTAESRWWVVRAVDKKRARLNCIAHVLEQMPYCEIEHAPIELPGRVHFPRCPTLDPRIVDFTTKDVHSDPPSL